MRAGVVTRSVVLTAARGHVWQLRDLQRKEVEVFYEAVEKKLGIPKFGLVSAASCCETDAVCTCWQRRELWVGVVREGMRESDERDGRGQVLKLADALQGL